MATFQRSRKPGRAKDVSFEGASQASGSFFWHILSAESLPSDSFGVLVQFFFVMMAYGSVFNGNLVYHSDRACVSAASSFLSVPARGEERLLCVLFAEGFPRRVWMWWPSRWSPPPPPPQCQQQLSAPARFWMPVLLVAMVLWCLSQACGLNVGLL